MVDGNRTLAVIGGTGALGGGLAWRLARAGHRVVIGSRTAEKAAAAADAIRDRLGGDAAVTGLANREAAEAGDVLFVTVPYASQGATLGEIREAARGKIVVDATAPLVPPKVATFQAPPEGCAALAAQAALGDEVTVVSAFQNVAAHKLDEDVEIDCDVLVFGDKAAPREEIVAIIDSIGLRGIHAGALANAVAAEALTSILIGINKRYKVDGAGIRITGTLTAPAPA